MNILAVSGSLQARSANTALLHAAQRLQPAGVEIVMYEGLASLPAFNPEQEGDAALAAVADWRERLREADGVLIASPEYAHSLPGSLKNALDWVVGSGELVGKPVVLVSASPGQTGGVRALLALQQVLSAMSAAVVDALTVPNVSQRLDADGALADPETERRLSGALDTLVRAASGR